MLVEPSDKLRGLGQGKFYTTIHLTEHESQQLEEFLTTARLTEETVRAFGPSNYSEMPGSGVGHQLHEWLQWRNNGMRTRQ